MNLTDVNKDNLLATADRYRILALAYSYPDKDTIELLKELCRDIEPETVPPAVREEFITLRDSASTLVPEELEGEFNELFMTRMFCPPYETSYGRHKFSKPEVLADISGFYKAFGFSVSDAEEMLDHIAVEMEFMSLLMLKEAYAVEQGLTEMIEICDSANRKFLSEHLGRWVEAFCNNLTQKTENVFYKNLAVFTMKFIKEEITQYGIEIEYAVDIFKDELAEGPMSCTVKEM